MKLYILRHEDRTIDASFFAPLSKKGIENSYKLKPILKNLNINKIYCSPFIRTLQTIYPYSKENNIKLNLEYGSIEIKHESIISPKSHHVLLPCYIAEQFNYNPKYESYIKTNEISYPENSSELKKRTIKLLKHFIKENYKSNDNILLVTHQGICKEILKSINSTVKINEDIEDYPTGTLSLVFDKDSFIYKKIN